MLRLPLKEYFTYHPPKTEGRKRRHDFAGKLTLDLCETLSAKCEENKHQLRMSDEEIQEVRGRLEGAFAELTSDVTCLNWIENALSLMFEAINYEHTGSEDIVMYCQQVRMLLNIGIMIDEVSGTFVNPLRPIAEDFWKS